MSPENIKSPVEAAQSAAFRRKWKKYEDIKDRQILVGADFADYSLKEAVCEYLRKNGWTIMNVGVTDPTVDDKENMFHRVGLRVGAEIVEGEFEHSLIFCRTDTGSHIAASKCPHVHTGVVITLFMSETITQG